MDELHSEMRIIQSYPDDKQRSESSSTESSEIPIILSKYDYLISWININSQYNFSRNVESEYETCNSGFTSSTEDNSNDDEKSKYSSLNEIEEYSKRKLYRQKSKSLSRSDSGVSLNTNKQQYLMEEFKVKLNV